MLRASRTQPRRSTRNKSRAASGTLVHSPQFSTPSTTTASDTTRKFDYTPKRPDKMTDEGFEWCDMLVDAAMQVEAAGGELAPETLTYDDVVTKEKYPQIPKNKRTENAFRYHMNNLPTFEKKAEDSIRASVRHGKRNASGIPSPIRQKLGMSTDAGVGDEETAAMAHGEDGSAGGLAGSAVDLVVDFDKEGNGNNSGGGGNEIIVIDDGSDVNGGIPGDHGGDLVPTQPDLLGSVSAGGGGGTANVNGEVLAGREGGADNISDGDDPPERSIPLRSLVPAQPSPVLISAPSGEHGFVVMLPQEHYGMIVSLVGDVLGLKERVTVAEDNVFRLMAENEDLKGRVAGLEDENEGLEVRTGDLEAEKEDLKGYVAGLDDENEGLKERTSDLEAEKEDLKGRVAGLEADNKGLEERTNDLEAENEGLKGRFTTENESLKGRVTEVETDLDDFVMVVDRTTVRFEHIRRYVSMPPWPETNPPDPPVA